MIQFELAELALNTVFEVKNLVIKCPNYADCKKIAVRHEKILATWARRMNKQATILRSIDGSGCIPINASLAESTINTTPMGITNGLLFSNFDPKIWDEAWIKILQDMATCNRPQVLIRISDQRQLWCNQLFADVMQSGGNQVVTRSIVDFWDKQDLIKLDVELKTASDFEIEYSALLNESGIAGNLKAHNRIYQLNGVFYRLSTNLECKLIPKFATVQ